MLGPIWEIPPPEVQDGEVRVDNQPDQKGTYINKYLIHKCSVVRMLGSMGTLYGNT
jgi:hypothetical protein